MSSSSKNVGNYYALKQGLHGGNHQLSKKERGKRGGLHITTYWLLSREFSQGVKGRNYDARYIYHLEDRICMWKQHVEKSQIGSKKSMQMWERDHLHKFFLVGKVFLIYLIIKLKVFVQRY